MWRDVFSSFRQVPTGKNHESWTSPPSHPVCSASWRASLSAPTVPCVSLSWLHSIPSEGHPPHLNHSCFLYYYQWTCRCIELAFTADTFFFCLQITFLFFFFLSFLGPHPWHVEVPRLGQNQSCCRQTIPQLCKARSEPCL